MRREKVQVFGAVINGEYHGKPEQVQSNGELTALKIAITAVATMTGHS